MRIRCAKVSSTVYSHPYTWNIWLYVRWKDHISERNSKCEKKSVFVSHILKIFLYLFISIVSQLIHSKQNFQHVNLSEGETWHCFMIIFITKSNTAQQIFYVFHISSIYLMTRDACKLSISTHETTKIALLVFQSDDIF